MLCNEFDARLQRVLDERKSPEMDPVLRRHAQRCSDCRGRLETLSHVLDSLNLMEVPDLPPEFAQRVVDSVLSAKTKSATTPSTPTWLLAAGLAATLLVAAVPLAWQALRGDREVARPTPSQTIAPHTTPDSPESLPPDALGDGWRLVSMTLLELYPAETRQRHRQQVNQIAHDLRPIATPFNAAMTAIRRSLPVGRSQPKSEPRAAIDHPSHAGGIS